MKFIHIVLLCILTMLTLSGCQTQQVQEPAAQMSDKHSVVATFFPFQQIAAAVLQDVATVESIVPPTAEPHGYNPTPKDISKVTSADIFITSGVEFEAFEHQLEEAAENALIIEASDGLTLLADTHDEHEGEQADEEHQEDEHNKGVDPHVWLSFENMNQIADTIAQEYILKYPESQSVVESNLAAFKSDIARVQSMYDTRLATCQKDTILVAHNAYQYLANEYGFDTISVAGLSPDTEPSPRQFAELIEEAREHNLSVVFFEELVNPTVSQAIATEVGAQTLPLNPGSVSPDGATLLEIWEQNLNNLVIGLECQ